MHITTPKQLDLSSESPGWQSAEMHQHRSSDGSHHMTARALPDGEEFLVTYKWSSSTGRIVSKVRVYEFVAKKFQYFTPKSEEVTIRLPPGVYRFDSMCDADVDKRLAHKASEILVGFSGDHSFDFGIHAHLHSSARRKYHSNLVALQSAIDRGESTLATKPMAASLILEGRGCNFSCFYCSHILQGSGFNLSAETTYTKNEKIVPGQNDFAGYVVGRTVGTGRAMVDNYKELFPYLKTLMFGGSEPTLYPEFREMLHAVREQNGEVQMSVCTNGSLIDDDLARLMTSTNFPWLRISIDGATRESFGKVRKGDFEKVISNIKRVVALRGPGGAPKIQFNFVCCLSNYQDIVPLVELSHAIGVSAINYKMLISPPEHSRYTEPFKNEDPLPDSALCGHILDLMDLARVRATELGVRIVADAISSTIYARHPKLRNATFRHGAITHFHTRAGQAADAALPNDGPVSLEDWVKTADQLRVMGSFVEGSDAEGTYQVVFTKSGGARVQLEVGENGKEKPHLAQSTIFRDFKISLSKGRYWIRMRPYFIGRKEQRQPNWQDKVHFQVGDGEIVAPYEPVRVLAGTEADEINLHALHHFHYTAGTNVVEAMRTAPRAELGQDWEDVEAMAALEEGETESSGESKDQKISWPKVFCHLPFTNISAGHNRAHFCCWAKDKFHHITYLGGDVTVDDLWNHPTFVLAREAMYNGRAFEVCKPSCPHLHKGGVKTEGISDPPARLRNKSSGVQ